MRDGDVVRAADVNATTFPDAARSYLADGTIAARGTFDEVVAANTDFATQARLSGLA